MLVCMHSQIARKRHKVISTFKSPLGQTRPPAQLKHITLMPLSQIRRVLDLRDTEGKLHSPHNNYRTRNFTKRMDLNFGKCFDPVLDTSE